MILLRALLVAAICSQMAIAGDAEQTSSSKSLAAAVSREAIRQRFENHCFGCHADGADEGNFSFDDLAAGKYGDKTLRRWEAVWKNIGAQTMPPPDEEQPHPSDRKKWNAWIQRNVFQLDPSRIDPGKVVLRRLNRTEYRETILRLTYVEFDVDQEFPADDTGYGFDTIGEVLHVSPILMEKYLAAAETIVNQVVPLEGPSPPESRVWSKLFFDGTIDGPARKRMLFDQRRSLHMQKDFKHPGRYRIEISWHLADAWTHTKQIANAQLVWHKQDGSKQKLDSAEIGFLLETKGVLKGEVTVDDKPVHLSLEFNPTSNDTQPSVVDYKSPVPYSLVIHHTDFIGPTDNPKMREYRTGRRLLSSGPPPDDADEATLDRMTADCVRHFGLYAFRRPVDDSTVERLVAIARKVRNERGRRFEHGIAEIGRLILASPRFLFRIENPLPEDRRTAIPESFASSPLGVPIDEYALAVRISYFLWGSPPNHHLIGAAEAGQLREQLDEQVDRMIAEDWRLRRGVSNFVGQWLQMRDVHEIPIDVETVAGANSEPIQLDWNLREAMKEETESLFRHLIMANRPVEELLNADYTFLNEPLARLYGMKGLEGYETQRVDLKPNSHRGGLLRHASMLMVTSNPTRTSPVKRGLFLLKNVLGTPAPPPPPDIPALEDAQRGDLKNASLREILEFHRSKSACAGCHGRMDPLGLALENYNALGQYREREQAGDRKMIDPRGQLMTGEKFDTIDELANILANERRDDFYRCLTEKMLVFALGRGLTYRDATTVDNIVNELKADHGRMRTLLFAILRSVPFNHIPKPLRIAIATPE